TFYLGGFSTATNNKGLYLQRFNSVGNVDTSFNFKSGTVHAFYDLTAGDDIIHDMVKQNDGKIILVGESNNAGFYTRIMDVSLNTPSFEMKNETVILSPNPVSNSFHLQFENEINEQVTIRLIDIFGKEVYTISNPDYTAQNTITVNNLETLLSGLYFVKITSNTNSKVLKFIKK
ncbi:MAG TPA: T9SS type A sorting domain-containing protein, partial [Flavobacterium sp.]|nr:T9SS type A sorting domain-containing protein [Flavobacterium sp.]